MAKSWKVLALLNIALVAADLEVYSKRDPMIIFADFLDAEANFGLDIPKNGIPTMVVLADPEDGCGKIQPPPNVSYPTPYWAVLIKRYNCSFEEKVFNAQEAFYDVAIVHNVESNKLEIMNASNPDRINIRAVFISGNAGKEIKMNFLYNRGFIVRIRPNSSGDWLGKILIPFVIIVSTCFVFMFAVMIVRCIKDRRRAMRRRMPYSSLDKIPTAKFRKNDPFETCAICLDDFIEGEKLRILPCSHAYHCKCIDPWLTRNRRVCPMCKRKVLTADDPDTDDSLSEDDDHTPLLRGRGPTYGVSTGPSLPWSRDIQELLNDLPPEIHTMWRNRQQPQSEEVGRQFHTDSSSEEGEAHRCAHRYSASHSDSFGSASSGIDSDDNTNPFAHSGSSQPGVSETISVLVEHAGSTQETGPKQETGPTQETGSTQETGERGGDTPGSSAVC